MRAIDAGDQFQVKAAQEFYLRSSETLRRLDLAVETERRNAGEQVPLRQVEDIVAQIATWLRTSFEQFLSAESPGLMAIMNLGDFKFSAIERFRAASCTQRLKHHSEPIRRSQTGLHPK